MGHGARRDRVEGAVRGVGPERVLQGVGGGAARMEATGGERPPHRKEPLPHRVHVLEPARRDQVGRGRDLPLEDHPGGRAHVGPAVSVLGRPVVMVGVGHAVRVAGPLLAGARRLGLGDHRLRRVHQDLLHLVRREPGADHVLVARVEGRGLGHRQGRGHERRGAGCGHLPAGEDVVGPVARHVRAGAEPGCPRGGRPALVLEQRVARDDVVPQHPVGVVHRVEVVRVERQQDALVVRVVDGALVERAVGVADNDRADRSRTEVGRVEDRLPPLVGAAQTFRPLLDRNDAAVTAGADARVAVVRLAGDQREEPGRVAV